MSREIVSSSQGGCNERFRLRIPTLISQLDHGLSVVPTKDWQDNLSKYIASDRGSPNSCTPDSEDGHALQRRRLSGYLKAVPQDWNSLYTIDTPDGIF